MEVRTRIIRMIPFVIRRLLRRRRPPNDQLKKPPVINHTPWVKGRTWTK